MPSPGQAESQPPSPESTREKLKAVKGKGEHSREVKKREEGAGKIKGEALSNWAPHTQAKESVDRAVHCAPETELAMEGPGRRAQPRVTKAPQKGVCSC